MHLKKVLDPSKSEADRLAIQVTPEMILAGCKAYRDWEDSEGDGCWDERLMVRRVLEVVLGERVTFD